MFRRELTAIVLIVSALCGAITSGAVAERRVALVVGNSAYSDPSLKLTNPNNDAGDIAKALRSIGFETFEAIDTTKRDFEQALEQFAMAASRADSALFFYAGHAMQFHGRNYLMPVDARLENEFSVRYQMISADDVRDALDRTSGVKVMILDACRNNPLAERLRTQLLGQRRSIGNVRGLTRIDTVQGMVVAYATGADQVALDGTGRNSPFTTALLKRMQEPGLEIGIMMRHVTQDVFETTSGKQRPATYTDLTTPYYLNQSDRLAWDRIKDSTDPNAFNDFIQRFPSSPLALTAKSRMDMFDRFARERRETEALLARLAEERRLLAEITERRRQAEEAERRQAEARRLAEQEATKQRESEKEAKAAAERERLDQQERIRRAAEERARAAAEQARREQEAAERRTAEEQAAKRAAEERARKEAEAARIREQEQQALREAAARMRAERDATERRAAEARRLAEQEAARQREAEKEAKAAAERERLNQQERIRRAAEERARAAAAEQARREQEAAERLAAEEQAAKLAAEERARKEAEAARIRELEQQALREAAARMRAEREAAERRAAEARREQEAAERRAAEEQAAKLAAELARQERQAAEQREQERKEALAIAERQRIEQEAAIRHEAEQAVGRAAAERAQKEADAARTAEQGRQLQVAANSPQQVASEHEAKTRQATDQRAEPSATAVAALENPAVRQKALPEPVTDTPELIRAAQKELRRLGCLSGRDTGALNAATRDAVKKYLSQTGQKTATVAITHEFVTDLKAHRQRACAPSRPVASHPPAKPTPPKQRRQPSNDAAAAKPGPAAPARAPQSSRPMIGIGF